MDYTVILQLGQLIALGGIFVRIGRVLEKVDNNETAIGTLRAEFMSHIQKGSH